ncbi:MAG: signal recognition particle-docking protein FtsY, partial [Armatimonadota bacterium]
MLRGILRRVGQLLTGKRPVDDDLLDELEEALIAADVSYDLTMHLVERLREEAEAERCKDAEEVKTILQRMLRQLLQPLAKPLELGPERPAVIVMLGVNGVGKTTTIAKLAYRYRRQGLKPMMVAADTFRAAAAEQLEEWSRRVGCDLVRQRAGADPGAVVFDALEAARARGTDVVIIDTAGRLHTKKNLMDELGKIVRIAERQLGRPPDERLLVLDATTGQNALNQARQFNEIVQVTGLILAKLDGTAKGGIV